ncbi:MAG: ABC transporter permease [Sulfolobales archaeon]
MTNVVSGIAYLGGRFRTLATIVSALTRDKRGLAGLLIVVVYGLLGGLGPLLIPYHPIYSQNLADGLAMPEWAASPDTPRNINQTLNNWYIAYNETTGNVTIKTYYVQHRFIIEIQGNGEANITIMARDYIYYPYKPANSLSISSYYDAGPIDNRSMAWYRIAYYLINLDLIGKWANVTTGGENYTVPLGIYVFYDDPGFRVGALNPYVRDVVERKPIGGRQPAYVLNEKQPYPIPSAINPVRELLLAKDTRLSVGLNISYYCDPTSFLMRCENGGVKFVIRPINIFIYGQAFGLLGTDYLGADVWTKFVYGARSAIIFGFSVALAIIFIGLFVGITAGYFGGTLRDYILTFITDVVYFIPTLPLILAAGIVFGRSILVIYIVVVLLSWPGTARVIRSWTMALRSELYVEAAQALGAGTGRILIKHIIPQLVPYMVYAVVVGVPGAVFTEVAIQLLGFGDPYWPSWGKILNDAFYQGAITSGAWWWIMPPIFGIVTLALGFALMGLALDEIANPRLRRRL